MDNDLGIPRTHDGRADWHLLDIDAGGRHLVMFSDLRIVIQVFFALYRRAAWMTEPTNAIQPFYTSGANVTQDKSSHGVPMNFRERFSIHAPHQQYFFSFDLGIRHRHQVVHEIVLEENVS